jgi:ribonucleotide reductase alpha subunit
VTKLRAAGSPLEVQLRRRLDRPDSFAKIIDTAIRAIQRGGKKKGALCFYMENWHLDFPSSSTGSTMPATTTPHAHSQHRRWLHLRRVHEAR